MKAIMLAAALVCMAIAGARSVYALIYNGILQSEFKENESSATSNFQESHYLPYSEVVSMYQMGEALDKSAYSAFTLYPFKLERGGEYVFKLSHDVKFYYGPGEFEKPICVLESGTEVRLSTEILTLSKFPNSFPTFQKGWRFVSPDSLALSCVDELENESLDIMYGAYVRLDDLENLWRDFQKGCPEGAQFMEADADEDITSIIYISDNMLKEKGVYLSPDLLKSLWDTVNTVLILFAAACALASFALKRMYLKGGAENE